MLALLLASAGCTAPHADLASNASVATAQTPDAPAVPEAPEWWREAGDPILTALIQQGLDSSAEISCRVSGLRRYDFEMAQDAKRIGARIGRLLGAEQKAEADARALAREERVQRVATRRAHLAREIALAYVEVRRLQQGIALRSGLHEQYKDNAEVARFRREAGLVSAIDGALARSQHEAALGELGFAQGGLAGALSQLARLTGETPEALSIRLGDKGPMPDPAIEPLAPATPENARLAALANDVLRETRLVQALAEARRTVRDARRAYREGVGDFATLYVAESALTTVNLALVDATARRVMATLDLSSRQDAAWTRKGLDPVVAPDPLTPDETIIVTAGCD